MPVIIVERTFPNPPSEADVKGLFEKQAQCVSIYGVTYKHSIWSNDHRRMICHYEAADTESVRKVQRETGAPYDQIWTGNIIS